MKILSDRTIVLHVHHDIILSYSIINISKIIFIIINRLSIHILNIKMIIVRVEKRQKI